MLTVAASPYTITYLHHPSPHVAAVEATSELIVAPAPLKLVVDDKTMAFDSTLPTLTGTVTGVVNSDGITASFSTTATPTSPVGSYPITATLDDPKGRLSNYTVSNVAGTLTITPATPTVTWAMPATIVYGTPLGTMQLDANASVPGSFSYTPAQGTVLPSGKQEVLSVAFMPTDTTDYLAVPSTVTTIDVLRQATTTTLTTSAPGQTTKFTATVTKTASAPSGPTGSVQFQVDGQDDSAPVPLSPAGTASISVAWNPASSDVVTAIYLGDGNYQASTSPSVNVPLPGPGAYAVGTTLYLFEGASKNTVQITTKGKLGGLNGLSVDATLDGKAVSASFTQALESIDIVGHGGNDTITINRSVTLAATITEGDGKDTITTGAGNTSISLGKGNDQVSAGQGERHGDGGRRQRHGHRRQGLI